MEDEVVVQWVAEEEEEADEEQAALQIVQKAIGTVPAQGVAT